MNFSKFTYPFSYTPHPLVREEAERLISRIASDPELDALFREGKMLGVLLVEDPASPGEAKPLYGFSGLAGGRSHVTGFVPPIFDLADPQGEFKRREAKISAMPVGEPKSQASRELQDWIFEQFVVFNAEGESRSIKQVFAEQGLVPPGGTGECALPRMLQYAYSNGYRPLAFGEFWYGASGRGEVRSQGCFYPSCTGKCGPLLKFMLEGLEVDPNPDKADASAEPSIIYEDDSIVVASKPSGMLSVPGKIESLSLLVWLQRKLGMRLFSCHRLDMDTSGLLVFAKNVSCQAAIQRQFENREVEKSYLALLCDETGPGAVSLDFGMKGEVDLPLALDYYDRPRQMVDFESGKPALTLYEVLSDEDDRERRGGILVRFFPKTGRTHQLRVHAASSQGLGRPIKGDRLYGGMAAATEGGADEGVRGALMLHAEYIKFTHPESGRVMKFSLEPSWL